MSRKRRQYKTMSEINVTNLVDVVLVLLIVFMISAPLLQSGIEVDLPQTQYVESTDAGEGLVVTVTSKDSIEIYVGTGVGDERFASPITFDQIFEEFLVKNPSQAVYLRADKTARWEYVIDIISRIKKQGVTDLGLVTAPFEKK